LKTCGLNLLQSNSISAIQSSSASLGGYIVKKTSSIISILLVLATLLAGYHSVQASPDYVYRINTGPMNLDPAVQTALGNLNSGEMLTVIVTLRGQADLSRINGSNRAARQQGVIRALQATANATQGQLISFLATRKSQGLVKSYTPFWVFNGFSVTATGSVIIELAGQSDVYSISSDDLQIVPTYGTSEPNISLINAPALWSQGYTGQGVVVASMDTGVDVYHPDLSYNWRGGSNSWFDPYNQHPTTPTDLNGHGTWTTGVMVGGDADGTTIGVAPDAQWIAVKIFNDSGSSTATAIHLGFQWLLDPDGNPSTDDAPNVVNNSWTYSYPGCYMDFESDLHSLRVAGILPVFAAGNGGPYSNSSYSPANNPSAFAVGAIDNNSQIYAYSSRGPNSCTGSTGPYPDLVAPGVNVKTSGLLGSYPYESGTSLASPHVAGGLALLLSAYPNLDAGMQEQALINTAVDLGASGPDDVFGYGRMDLASALDWASTAPTSTPEPTFTPTYTPTSTPSPTPVPHVNLALNRLVTVSSYSDSSHSGSKAVDGNSSTQWQTQKVKGRNGPSTEWLEVDLGSTQSVSQVVMGWDSYYATVYDIQTSSDNNNWSTVFSESNGDGGSDTFIFNTVQARYVRMTSSAWNNNSNRNWLNEFEVYPDTGTSNDPPTFTPEPTVTPTATPSPTPTSAANNNSVHVGDLGSIATANGSRWDAVVFVTIHDNAETPLSDVTVNGSWGGSANGSGSCVTGSDGTCSISKNNLKTNVSSVTFTVTGLSASLPYDSSSNHDLDGNSDGTIIVILKP
jgi:serine protease AprX